MLGMPEIKTQEDDLDADLVDDGTYLGQHSIRTIGMTCDSVAQFRMQNVLLNAGSTLPAPVIS